MPCIMCHHHDHQAQNTWVSPAPWSPPWSEWAPQTCPQSRELTEIVPVKFKTFSFFLRTVNCKYNKEMCQRTALVLKILRKYFLCCQDYLYLYWKIWYFWEKETDCAPCCVSDWLTGIEPIGFIIFIIIPAILLFVSSLKLLCINLILQHCCHSVTPLDILLYLIQGLYAWHHDWIRLAWHIS